VVKVEVEGDSIVIRGGGCDERAPIRDPKG